MLILNTIELLDYFYDNQKEILWQIHADPLLSKRSVDGLFIANASKELHEPTEIHQQLAKGIVYTFIANEPVLVSLALPKIWNAHEKALLQTEEINNIIKNPSKLFILEKLDGTMISRFVWRGKVYFTTRGVISGDSEYDSIYINKAIEIATNKYPKLLDAEIWPDNTLIMELIFPEGKIITNYSDLEELTLIAALHDNICYFTYYDLKFLAKSLELPLVKMIEVPGNTYLEKMDNALASIKGTDLEGFVMVLEQSSEVVYRMKFKGEDYIRTLKIMNRCSYKNVVEICIDNGIYLSSGDFRKIILRLGGDDLPIWVIDEYIKLHEQFNQYFNILSSHVCKALIAFVEINPTYEFSTIMTGLERKELANKIKDNPYKSLIFEYANGKNLGEVEKSLVLKTRGSLDKLKEIVNV